MALMEQDENRVEEDKMRVIIGVILLAGILFANISEAVETKIVVRAKSRDAKFIGSSMGGAKVVIKDGDTGDVIKEGLTVGGTGDTKKMILEPIKRGSPLSDASSAKFEASMDIEEPRLITVEVYAPYSQRQSMVKSSTQVWLIPGKDIIGDGIIVEIPGFAVDLMTPQIPEGIRLTEGKAVIPIKANIVMMCGCPTEPGGLWDANRYEIKAIIKHDGGISSTIPLRYAGKKSTFETELEVTRTGLYEIIVYSYDPATGNTGLDRSVVAVSE